MEKIPKLNKCRAFFKAVGLEKNPKLINIGPTFIPDYRVCVPAVLRPRALQDAPAPADQNS